MSRNKTWHSFVEFAVVADEIRELANRSADAAKNTEVLIEDSVTAVKGRRTQSVM